MTAATLALTAIWLVGWLLDVRPALRRRMLTETCIQCRKGKSCSADHGGRHGPKAPRGAISERRGTDAAVAVWVAAWWPGRLLVVWFVLLLRIIGRGVGAAVLSTRLTAPEMERRVNEQAAEIARLTKEIDEGAGLRGRAAGLPHQTCRSHQDFPI